LGLRVNFTNTKTKHIKEFQIYGNKVSGRVEEGSFNLEKCDVKYGMLKSKNIHDIFIIPHYPQFLNYYDNLISFRVFFDRGAIISLVNFEVIV